MMPERKWLPSLYQDESIPPPRATPTAWLDKPVGDLWQLGPADDISDEEDTRLRIKPGDVVPFEWTDYYGRTEIMIRPDGTYTTAEPVPAGAEQFMCPWDPDTISDSLSSFVENMAQGISGSEPETFLMSMYTWAPEPTMFRLVVDGEGARFVQAAPATSSGEASR